MSLTVLPPAEGKRTGEVVAFLTPKRLGSAVTRNRLRRRMREVFRRHLQGGRPDVYLVWVARSPACELTFPDLRAHMAELMRRSQGNAVS